MSLGLLDVKMDLVEQGFFPKLPYSLQFVELCHTKTLVRVLYLLVYF